MSSSSAAVVPSPEVAPFGSWRSPITTRLLVQKSIRFGDMSVDGDTVLWVESRPSEGGRNAVVAARGGAAGEDLLPPPFNARTLAHEYGGGALLAAAGVVFFANFEDQQIWQVRPGETPVVVTAAPDLRFADLQYDATRRRLVAVAEDHSSGGEPASRIVSIELAAGSIADLVSGADFYSSPRVSPDGKQLAWLCWDHPNMPWDGTELWLAELAEDGSLGERRCVAGGVEESIFQPEWSPQGSLHFVSDRNNWWNLYREVGEQIEPVAPIDAELGGPQWLFGMSSYGFLTDGTIVTRFCQGGMWRVGVIAPGAGQLEVLDLPFSAVFRLHSSGERCFAEVASPSEPEMVGEFDLSGGWHLIRSSTPQRPDPAYTSVPQAIEFPTAGGLTAHAFYYPPANQDFRGPLGAAPPLLVIIHGGPTSQTTAHFRLSTQFWTSRGFAVCDVNYGGSTGYGREYRNRLRDSWGLVDVADAANAARFLADRGLADRDRLIIRGGSAGGYTTLACLAFCDLFRCGASYYGISDLTLLARDTHKFESRYLDRMVGPYPEAAERYRERSPIEHLAGFDQPIILLQGLEDKVVLPNQAELILDSLRTRGVPVAYVPFAGEQHGFRKAENIIRAHEAELYFYSRILGFPLADSIEPVEIFNFDE